MHLGSYELGAPIGRGGMGTVHRGRARDGREVAIKLLARSDADTVARFERERRLLGGFSAREGFVPLLDAGTGPRGPYLVMPLLAGGTLRSRLQRGALGIDETIAIGRALASALATAHGRGVVHRDVKPENVLFDDAGRALLADLGLAKHFASLAPGASQSVDLSLRGAFLGTAGYMAPEQMTDATTVGPAADVFALGAVLYECLAGRPAFEAPSVVELLQIVQRGTVEPLAARRKDAPAWLVAAIERALARRLEARLPDGAAFARALAGPARSRRRGARLLALGVLVVAGLVGSAVARSASVRSRAYTLANEGRAKVRARDVDGGLTDLARALELDPGCALAYGWRGAARLEQRDLDRALADAEKALALDPNVVIAWAVRAKIRSARGQRDEALADANRAVELLPDSPEPLVVRGGLHDSRREYDQAFADLSRAIALGSTSADARVLRSTARLARGDLEGALADSDEALRLDPMSALAWQGRAAIHHMRRDFPGEVADTTRAIELDPGFVKSWASRANAHLFLGEADAAIEDATRAIQLDAGNPHVWGIRAQARASKGELPEAIDDATRAIELDPKLPISWQARGSARQSRQEWDGAIADFTSSIAIDPRSWEAFLRRGICLRATGRRAEAAADLRRYLELAPPGEPNIARIRELLPELEARSEAR